MPAFSSHIFVTAGLCLVAYLLGVRRRQLQADLRCVQTIRRANEIAIALQKVINELRSGVREHQTQVAAFQGRLLESNVVDLHQVEAVVSNSHELVSKLVEIGRAHV